MWSASDMLRILTLLQQLGMIGHDAWWGSHPVVEGHIQWQQTQLNSHLDEFQCGKDLYNEEVAYRPRIEEIC